MAPREPTSARLHARSSFLGRPFYTRREVPFHVSPLPLKKGGARSSEDGTQLHARTVCSPAGTEALLIGTPEATPAVACQDPLARVFAAAAGAEGPRGPLLLSSEEDPFTRLPVPAVAGSPVPSGRNE